MTCTQLERSAAAVVAAKVAAVAAAMEEEEEEDRAAAAAAALVAEVVGDRLPMLHLEGDSLFFFFYSSAPLVCSMLLSERFSELRCLVASELRLHYFDLSFISSYSPGVTHRGSSRART